MDIIQSVADFIGQTFEDQVPCIRVLLAKTLQLLADEAIGSAVGKGQGGRSVAIPAKGSGPAEDPSRQDRGHRDRLTVLGFELDGYLAFFEQVKILGGGILLEDLHPGRQLDGFDDGEQQFQSLITQVLEDLHGLKVCL